MIRPVFLCFSLCLGSLAAQSKLPLSRGRILYLANCARCHGDEGRADGPTKVFPPPRNFREGGFSFGNSEQAIFRTITHGIPGTAMTSFKDSLKEEERHHLARYIRTLLPKTGRRELLRRRMVVGSRALIARGYLARRPPGEGNWPRGLACGLPGGFTLCYRYDDLRLLEVRRGPFLSRTDWGGRGGSPLKLLGRDFYVAEGGHPAAPFERLGPFGSRPLKARLLATEVSGAVCRLSYTLLDREGSSLLPVVEQCLVPPVRGATGFMRRLELGPPARVQNLGFRVYSLEAGARFVSGWPRHFSLDGPYLVHPLEEDSLWVVVRKEKGFVMALHLQTSADSLTLLKEDSAVMLRLKLVPGELVRLDLALLKAPHMSGALQESLESDLEDVH